MFFCSLRCREEGSSLVLKTLSRVRVEGRSTGFLLFSSFSLFRQ